MFSKKPDASPRPMPIDRAMTGSNNFSVLGADIVLKGDVTATADLHIDGRVEGDIACAALVQGNASEIAGAITADSARLAGTVRGAITARELVILKTARIEGDVAYEALTIEQGAQVDGRFKPRTGAAETPGAPPEDGEPYLTLAN